MCSGFLPGMHSQEMAAQCGPIGGNVRAHVTTGDVMALLVRLHHVLLPLRDAHKHLLANLALEAQSFLCKM
jgi:hypothetical protein